MEIHWKFMADLPIFDPGSIRDGLAQLGHGFGRREAHLPVAIQQALARPDFMGSSGAFHQGK